MTSDARAIRADGWSSSRDVMSAPLSTCSCIKGELPDICSLSAMRDGCGAK